jgi:hypothetical protein
MFAGLMLAGFLFYGNYTNVPKAWYWINSDIQQQQHLLVAALLVGGSLLALIGLRFRQLWLQAGLPIAVMAVGLVFLIHPQHGTGPEAARVLLIHRIFGISLMVGGFTQTLALFMPTAREKLLIVTAVGLFVAGVAFIVYEEPHPPADDQPVAFCTQTYDKHVITIQHGVLSPAHTLGNLCDRLTVRNLDDTPRLIAFGKHIHHQAYDGVSERMLQQGQSVTVTLNQAGTFIVHDHLHDEATGDFTVSD